MEDEGAVIRTRGCPTIKSLYGQKLSTFHLPFNLEHKLRLCLEIVVELLYPVFNNFNYTSLILRLVTA